jgi:small subunit ribosomal protein S27e
MSPRWEELIPRPRSTFLRVRCTECENEQVVFDSATVEVKCNVCENTLAEPTGGRVKIIGEIVSVLE